MESQIIIPAEQLSAGVATAAMRSTNTRRKPAGVFCSAWNHVEYAMSDNDSIDDSIRTDYFDYAQDLLGEVIIRPDSYQDVRFSALRLSSCASVFRKRRLGEEVTSNDCQELYYSIGAVLALLRPLELAEPPQSIMIEAGCEALSARLLLVKAFSDAYSSSQPSRRSLDACDAAARVVERLLVDYQKSQRIDEGRERNTRTHFHVSPHLGRYATRADLLST